MAKISTPPSQGCRRLTSPPLIPIRRLTLPSPSSRTSNQPGTVGADGSVGQHESERSCEVSADVLAAIDRDQGEKSVTGCLTIPQTDSSALGRSGPSVK